MVIVLDSTPLGLLVYRPGFPAADECREWVRRQLSSGVRVFVPAIVTYEIRRDLRRGGRPTADPLALDIDVILAAQALSLELPPSEYVVATSNVGHLGLLVPARPRQLI